MWFKDWGCARSSQTADRIPLQLRSKLRWLAFDLWWLWLLGLTGNLAIEGMTRKMSKLCAKSLLMRSYWGRMVVQSSFATIWTGFRGEVIIFMEYQKGFGWPSNELMKIEDFHDLRESMGYDTFNLGIFVMVIAVEACIGCFGICCSVHSHFLMTNVFPLREKHSSFFLVFFCLSPFSSLVVLKTFGTCHEQNRYSLNMFDKKDCCFKPQGPKPLWFARGAQSVSKHLVFVASNLPIKALAARGTITAVGRRLGVTWCMNDPGCPRYPVEENLWRTQLQFKVWIL